MSSSPQALIWEQILYYTFASHSLLLLLLLYTLSFFFYGLFLRVFELIFAYFY